jgi:hypothetical protein
MTPESLDVEAKRFVVAQDRSNIYVVRTLGIAPLVFQVSVDGRMIGSVAPGTYHLVSAPPGEHTVAAFSQENQEQVKLTTQAGKNYFVEVSRRMGWVSPRVSLTQVADEEGRKMVQESQRAESMY